MAMTKYLIVIMVATLATCNIVSVPDISFKSWINKEQMEIAAKDFVALIKQDSVTYLNHKPYEIDFSFGKI